MQRTPDVLVIGGGVIGCAIADALARERRRVALVERGVLGGGASAAAAGVLAVGSGGEVDGPRLALRRASLAAFAGLAARLAAETGIDVGHRATGVLELSLTGADETGAAARAALRRAQGFRVERLDAAALRTEEPEVNPRAVGALLFPDDGIVDGGRLTAALAAAARRHGAALEAGREVLGVERAGRRIVRVRVGGDWIAPGIVVLAAGAWAARVPGVAPGLPVEPARGQMLALAPPRPLCRRVLSYADGYLVPRPDGEVHVGATVEHVGFDAGVTPAGLGALAAKIAALAPAGLQAPLRRVWAGLRPYAPDGGPIIGRSAETENLILACGHHRSGVLLAPVTAALVAAVVTGGAIPAGLEPHAAAFLPRPGAGA
jgi:glycine oxidase